MIITAKQAKKLLFGIHKVSVNLGISKVIVKAADNKFIFPDGQKITKKDLQKIIKKDNMCFLIKNNSIHPVSLFSEKTNNFYKLVPTVDWPTLEISGIRMHVTKTMSPKADTEKKISLIFPATGNVLDTCTGLGYTAIMASNTADLVHTYERDKNVIEIQKLNPYSEKLFRSKIIKLHNADIFEEIIKLKQDYFDRVVHDPPRQSLSPLLYSQDFYDQLYRVMKPGSILYHYTGDPGSKNRGIDIREGIAKRLENSGFSEVKKELNSLTAEK